MHSELMKPTTFLAILATTLVTTAQAGPHSIEKIVELLHKAKASQAPLPMLQKAKDELQDYKAQSGNTGLHRRGAQAVKAEGHDRKAKSLERINDAIAETKAGHDARSKIDITILEVRSLGSLKR